MRMHHILGEVVHSGHLVLIDPSGSKTAFGDPASGDPVVVRITDPSVINRFVLAPDLALGEGYMDGTVVLDQGDLHDLLYTLTRDLGFGGRAPLPLGWFRRLGRALARLPLQFNPAGLARRRIGHHYDVDMEFYDLFLDSNRQYSCGYFPDPFMTLEAAQAAKIRHIAAKLRLEPGMRVLDIGCGWGGLALNLARDHGVTVQGITLSREQQAVAQASAEAAGLADRTRFDLMDYRSLRGRFDRIVSVGMFEHVGVPHYRRYFEAIGGLLGADGIALVHSIGRADGPGTTPAWIRRYIFPGGYIPALSEVLPNIERARLWVTDLEVLRLHYAQTVRHWRERFQANRERAVAIRGERFCRMWEFYLAASETAFRTQGLTVFQAQLAKSVDAVPLTRDYMHEAEASTVVPHRLRA